MAEQESTAETETQLAHSPGTWTASPRVTSDELQTWWDVTVARGNEHYQYQHDLCMVFHSSGHAEANARLIAAAPDLLDALKTARRVLEVACGTKAPYIQEAFKVINAAIVKAVPR